MKTALMMTPLILGALAIGTDPNCEGEDNPMVAPEEPGCGSTCEPDECEDAYNDAMAAASCECPADAMIPEHPSVDCTNQQATMDHCTSWSSQTDLSLCEKLSCASKCFRENTSSCRDPVPEGLLATQTLEEKLEKCYRIAAMKDNDPTWNCKDDAGWFLRCARELGIPEPHGLSMWCKDCDDGDAHGHRIVIYKRDGKWCPGEPEKGERSACCKASKSDAYDCALNTWCGGTWWNPEKPPQDRYKGCKPKKHMPRSCDYCIKEPCSAEECKLACELLDLPEYVLCGAEETNTECTECCIDATSSDESRQKCLSDGGCAGKP